MNIRHLSCPIRFQAHSSVKYYIIGLILIDEETEAGGGKNGRTKRRNIRSQKLFLFMTTPQSCRHFPQSGGENRDTLLEITQKHHVSGKRG